MLSKKVQNLTVKPNFKQFNSFMVGTKTYYKVTLKGFYPNLVTKPGFNQYLKNQLIGYINKKVTVTNGTVNNTVITNTNSNQYQVYQNKLPIMWVKKYINQYLKQNTNYQNQNNGNPLQGVKLTVTQHKQLTTYVNNIINSKVYVITKQSKPNQIT